MDTQPDARSKLEAVNYTSLSSANNTHADLMEDDVHHDYQLDDSTAKMIQNDMAVNNIDFLPHD